MIYQTSSIPTACAARDEYGRRNLLAKSIFHRELQAELAEILKHKWIESEKVGHDIGWERARMQWVVKHRTKWRVARQYQRRQTPSVASF